MPLEDGSSELAETLRSLVFSTSRHSMRDWNYTASASNCATRAAGRLQFGHSGIRGSAMSGRIPERRGQKHHPLKDIRKRAT